MPHSMFKGVAVGEITRVICNTISPSLRTRYGRKLIQHFKHRKYHPSIIKKLKRMIRNPHIYKTQSKRKSRMERPLPFITKCKGYRPSLGRIISKRWKNTYNAHQFYSLYLNNPYVDHTNHKTIRVSLSIIRRIIQGNPTQENLQLSKAKPFIFLKFNHPKLSRR